MTNYSRGREKEYQALKELKEMGYSCSRTSGSHGIFDVVAYNTQELLLIQLKRTKKYGSYKKDIKQIREETNIPLCTKKQIWIWKDRKGWEKKDLTEQQNT